MLKDLKILNGIMDLTFNEYIYEYTISVNEDITKLDIYYESTDNCIVDIQNNDLINNNIVTIYVSNDEEINEYTIYVNKDNSTSVNSIEEYTKSLNVIPDGIELYKVQLLAIVLFIIIIIAFCFIFRKKKNNKLNTL